MNGIRARLHLPAFIDPLAVVGALALVGVWYLVAPVVGPLRLPSPTVTAETMFGHFLSSDVIAAGFGGSGGILSQLVPTVVRTLEGVAIGGVLGVGIGVGMAGAEPLRLTVQPPIEALRLTPSLVVVPFLVLWFGVSEVAVVGLIAFYTCVTLQLYAYNAVRNIPPEYLAFAATLGAGRLRRIRTVIIPAILPELIGGLRVVLQLAWGLTIVAELIGAQRGIGHMTSSMLYFFRADIIIAGILWVAVVAVAVDTLLKVVAYRLTRWAPTLGGQSAQAL